jgi:hypothetical protein
MGPALAREHEKVFLMDQVTWALYTPPHKLLPLLVILDLLCWHSINRENMKKELRMDIIGICPDWSGGWPTCARLCRLLVHYCIDFKCAKPDNDSTWNQNTDRLECFANLADRHDMQNSHWLFPSEHTLKKPVTGYPDHQLVASTWTEWNNMMQACAPMMTTWFVFL